LDFIFDKVIWESIKVSKIHKNDISEEFRIEKDLLNDFMHKYIYDKFKHQTIRYKLQRTNTGYTFTSRCNKYINEKCKSCWNLRINVTDESTHLYCKFRCNHITSLIDPIQSGYSLN